MCFLVVPKFPVWPLFKDVFRDDNTLLTSTNKSCLVRDDLVSSHGGLVARLDGEQHVAVCRDFVFTPSTNPACGMRVVCFLVSYSGI